MARRLLFGTWCVLLASCAQLAGISDAPTAPPEVTHPPDAEADADAALAPGIDASMPDTAAPLELADIAVKCNDVAVKKWTCLDKRWEYDFAPCTVTPRKVVLENPGKFPVAFIARRMWSGSQYVPNEMADGMNGELIGVLTPGGNVDISTAYAGGIFVLIGSVHPFDAAFLTAPDKYEGKVAYANAMLGGFPTNNELFAAELTATTAAPRCTSNILVFTKK